jgi:hypothetical protein
MPSSEHIFIGGDEADLDAESVSSGSPQQHFHIVNRAHALQTEMILFDGGWLSLREHRSSRAGEARMINLRYVDPKPRVERYFARRSFVLSVGFALGSVITVILAAFAVQLVVTVPATLLLLTASAVAFAVCAYKTRKTVVFMTRHGRAPVISLMATLGGFRALREIVPKLVAAIEKAADNEPETNKRLRSEMREHYRLRECGVLSQSVCTSSTQRILEYFE